MQIALLYIDDSEAERRLQTARWKGVLSSYFPVNFQVANAPTADFKGYEKIDGIILDYDLKHELDGMEVARRIHDNYPDLPIAIYSGIPPVRLRRMNPDAWWVKEVLDKNDPDNAMHRLLTFVSTIDVVKRALGRRKSLNRLGAEFRKT